jgi:Dolichyl-phosphate-mannose-protein mannosyltransferase
MRGPGRPVLALAFWTIVVLVVDVWWLNRYRASAVPEYDESGYMSIALHNFHALQADGLSGLVSSFVHQVPEAPLVPLVTVLPYLLLGADVGSSVATQLVAVAALGLATYALARRVVSAEWAALAAGVSIALPVVSDFSRAFHFAVPAAALLTAAAWALARSDGLRSRRWAVAAGVLVGCMVLARTMTIAYLPGIGAAALVICLRGPEIRRRLVSLALLAGAAAVVAGTWYAPNGNYRTVSDYLVGSGYGGEAGRYGQGYSTISIDYWLKQARVMVTAELFLPLALAMLACLVAFLVSRHWRKIDVRAALARLVRSDLVIPLLIVLEGYLALTSSRNVGTAFSLPWLPSLVVLCVVCAARVPSHLARRGLAAGLAAAAMFAVVMKSDAVEPLAPRTEVRIPAFATVPVSDGNWLARRDVAADGYRLPPASDPLPHVHREWVPFAERETKAVLAAAKARGLDPRLLVGTGDAVLSTTRFALGAALRDHKLPTRLLVPGSNAKDYARQLRDEAISLLVTADPPPNGGDVDRGQVAAAARTAGYRPFRTSTAPDGREVTWWWRRS